MRGNVKAISIGRRMEVVEVVVDGVWSRKVICMVNIHCSDGWRVEGEGGWRG